MIKQAKDILIILLLLFVAWHFFFSDKDEPKERIVIKTEIKTIPPIVGTSDIKINLKPTAIAKTHFKEVHLEEWERQQLIDSLKHYTAKRTYKESFTDSIITIKAETEVVGVQKSIFFDYQIKSQQVEVKHKETTLLPRRVLMGFQLTVGGLEHPSIGMSLGYQNRKGNVLYGGINSNGAALVGYQFNAWEF